MKTGKRHIKNGNQFNSFFPEVKGEFKLIKEVANLDDTIHLMKKVVSTTLEDTQAISEELEATTQKQTCSNIWNFCFNHLQYTKDEMGKEQVRRPARSWQDRTQGVDCDCMSVFIGSILTNLDIPFSFRLTKYESSEFEHVYIIAHTNHGILILDAVVHEFDREVQYSAKKDISMELEYLNGFEDENDDFDEFDELDEMIDNDYPMDAQSLVMDEDLLGLEGRAERRAKRAARRAARKKRKAEIKKLPRKERFKARLKQGLHVVNRFNPAAALLRLGMLASMKLNLMKASSKLRFGYWTDAEAKKNHMDMRKFQQLKRIRGKLEKIFFGAGGKTTNLKKAILTGKGNRDRKVVLNGLGAVITPVFDEDDLKTILGDDIYNDEMADGGVNGLGVVATASTAAAVTAAAGVIGTIAALIKKLGSLFKKGTPQAEQEMVQDNTDNQEEKTRKFSFKNLVSRVKNSGIKLPDQIRSSTALMPQNSNRVEEQFDDFPTTNYDASMSRQASTEEGGESDPKEKKGVVEWVKANPLLTAGIATVAVGGTILAVKAVKGKKKGLSGAPKTKRKKRIVKPKKVIAKKRKTPIKTRRKRKAPVRRRTVRKVKLL